MCQCFYPDVILIVILFWIIYKMSGYNAMIHPFVLIIGQGKVQHGHYSNQTFTIGG